MDSTRRKSMGRRRTPGRLQNRQTIAESRNRRKGRKDLNHKIRGRFAVFEKPFHISWRERSDIAFLSARTGRAIQSPGQILQG